MFPVKSIVQYFLRVSASATQNIAGVRRMPADIVQAGKIGYRRSRIDGDNNIKSLQVAGSSIFSRGVKPHLPGLLAGVGFCTPVPLGSVAGFGLGKLLQRIV